MAAGFLINAHLVLTFMGVKAKAPER